MGALRQQFEEDVTLNTRGCRVTVWLQGFEDDDDREFITELLESDRATDQLKLWFEKQCLPRIGKDKLNNHRKGRCTCGPDTRGRAA